MSEPTHYILVERWAVYVKTATFFRDQGGHEQPWGRKWRPVTADSIDAAREIGEKRRTAVGCLCREWVGDALKVEDYCPAHGNGEQSKLMR